MTRGTDRPAPSDKAFRRGMAAPHDQPVAYRLRAENAALDRSANVELYGSLDKRATRCAASPGALGAGPPPSAEWPRRSSAQREQAFALGGAQVLPRLGRQQAAHE